MFPVVDLYNASPSSPGSHVCLRQYLVVRVRTDLVRPSHSWFSSCLCVYHFYHRCLLLLLLISFIHPQLSTCATSLSLLFNVMFPLLNISQYRAFFSSLSVTPLIHLNILMLFQKASSPSFLVHTSVVKGKRGPLMVL